MKKFSLSAVIVVLLALVVPQWLPVSNESAESAAPSSNVSDAKHSAQTDKPKGNESSVGKVVQGLEIPRYESVRGGQIISHTGFTLSYDADYKTSQWVAWVLTPDKAEGTEGRTDKFQPDPQVRGAKAYHSDYTNSGYDRGHMAPAADMKWSAQAMEESFYLSNICPQNPNLNRGDWKDLEELEREWAKNRGTVYIVAGPIYRTKRPQRIGANKVAVPDAFYKVLLVDYPQSPKAYGFIFKNEAGSRPLTYYQLKVDEVERQTGIDFFAALPDEVESKIENVVPKL